VTRSSLIASLQKRSGITKSEAESVVRIFFDRVSEALAGGDRVELRGLCSFRVKKYRPYTGVNPKTGGRFRVRPKKLPFFKCGAELKQRLNNGCDSD